MAIPTEIRNLLECHVVGSDGQQIGKVGQVYLSDRTGAPEWVTVRTGLFGMRQTFVPLVGARRAGDQIRVPYDKEKIKGAPNIDVDDRLTLKEEADLYRYYGMQPSTIPAQRRPEDAEPGGTAGTAGAPGATGTTDTTGTTGTTDTTGMPGAAGATGTPGMPGATGESGVTGSTGATSAAGTAGATGAAATPGETAGTAGRRPEEAPERAAGMAEAGHAPGHPREAEGDIDMTRSEERLHVGKERRESGHVRLRKYVIREEVEEIIPLAHDEVVIEHEILEEGAPVDERDLGEDEEVMILYEERPVVGTERAPVERVRVHKRQVNRDERVQGQVRKERFEVDRDGEMIDERAMGGETPDERDRRDER